MEDFENEHDRGLYWIIFFIILVVIAGSGYYLVFNAPKEHKEKEDTQEVEEELKYKEYIGVWYLPSDDDLPNEEVAINIMDGSTITFDYFIRDVARFDSQTATLEGNNADFNITNSDGTINISGHLTFRSQKIFMVIENSNNENISLGTIEFSNKTDNSLLNSIS